MGRLWKGLETLVEKAVLESHRLLCTGDSGHSSEDQKADGSAAGKD